MPVESMTCPNCGAKVEFPANATTTVCQYCNSTLRLKTEVVVSHDAIELDPKTDPYRQLADMDQIKQLLRDGHKYEATRLYMQQTGAGMKEAQQAIDEAASGIGLATIQTTLGPFAIDLGRIRQLVNDGQKIEAIKILREQTHVGLKEAKEAVEAIGRGEMPVITIDLRDRSTASALSRVPGPIGCLVAALPILFFIALCAGSIFFLSNIAFRVWGPYDQALDMVRTSEQVQAVFGSPINPGIFLAGSISGGDRSSSAYFQVPIFGAKRDGSLTVSGDWSKGTWDLSIWLAYDQDGEEQTIYLSGKRK